MDQRILAVDLGEKRIGIAISDPTKTIAIPITVIRHTTRVGDAAVIAQLCSEHEVGLIVLGIPVTQNGEDSPQLRHAHKFIEALKLQVEVPIVTWDESYSTNHAQEIRRVMRVPAKMRHGHLDDLAAAIILQSYLDSHPGELS